MTTCRESAETIVLLEAILGGLSDEKSGAKRELCANAAREFLLWSAKQIPMPKAKEGGLSNASASSNLNAASLLRRLFERLAHPEAYQRQESILAPLCICLKTAKRTVRSCSCYASKSRGKVCAKRNTHVLLTSLQPVQVGGETQLTLYTVCCVLHAVYDLFTVRFSDQLVSVPPVHLSHMSIYLSSIDAVLPALVMSYTTLHLAVTITAL